MVWFEADGSTLSYIPIQYGDTGFTTDSLTTITFGSQTGKNTNTTRARMRMPGFFSADGANQVSISGDLILSFKETARESTSSTFSLFVTLLNDEEEVSEGSFFTVFFDDVFNFLASLLGCKKKIEF